MLSPKRKKIRKVLFILVLALILVGSLVYAFLSSNFLKITHLEVQTKSKCLNNERLEKSFLGKSIIYLNESELNNELKKEFVCIKQVWVNKRYPSTINVSILDREPVLTLKVYKKALIEQDLIDESLATRSATASQSADLNFSLDIEKFFSLDQEGKIFTLDIQDELPILYIKNSGFNVGDSLKYTQIKFVLDAIKHLNDIDKIQTTEFKILNSKSLVVNSAPKLIFNLEKDFFLQLASLQLILQEAKMNEENAEVIDLRFEKPVIKYIPKKT